MSATTRLFTQKEVDELARQAVEEKLEALSPTAMRASLDTIEGINLKVKNLGKSLYENSVDALKIALKTLIIRMNGIIDYINTLDTDKPLADKPICHLLFLTEELKFMTEIAIQSIEEVEKTQADTPNIKLNSSLEFLKVLIEIIKTESVKESNLENLETLRDALNSSISTTPTPSTPESLWRPDTSKGAGAGIAPSTPTPTP